MTRLRRVVLERSCGFVDLWTFVFVASSFRRLALLALGVMMVPVLACGTSAAHAASDGDEWWERSKTLRADPYHIRTDLPRGEAEVYAQNLQRIHAAFERALGRLPRRSPGDYDVLLFQTHADYLHNLQSRFDINAVGTGGIVFDRPEGSTVAIWIEDRPRRRILHILQHEAFHQFARTRFGTDLPPWVDEGLAEYFGNAIVSDRAVIVGEIPPSLLNSVQDAIELDKHVPFRELFRMGDDDWWSELRRGRGPLVYHQAWSMVHFLLHGDNGRHRPAFLRYLRLIADGVRADRAFERAFEANDFDLFERAWRAQTIVAKPTPFVSALERIDFLAAGALELRKRGSRPTTLQTLERALKDIDFQRTMSIHGIPVTIRAHDENVFSIPAKGDARRPPRFVLSEPKRQILPRRQQHLVRENPPPATIATENLEPHNLVVEWIRDFDTNTLRYEIEFD